MNAANCYSNKYRNGSDFNPNISYKNDNTANVIPNSDDKLQNIINIDPNLFIFYLFFAEYI